MTRRKPTAPPVDDGPRIRCALGVARAIDSRGDYCPRLAALLGCDVSFITHAARGHRVALPADSRARLDAYLAAPVALPELQPRRPARERQQLVVTLASDALALLDLLAERPELAALTHAGPGRRRAVALDDAIRARAAALGVTVDSGKQAGKRGSREK